MFLNMLIFLVHAHFVANEDETLIHLLFSCEFVQKFWFDMYSHLNKTPVFAQSFSLKDTICYYSDSANKSKEYIFNFVFSLEIN